MMACRSSASGPSGQRQLAFRVGVATQNPNQVDAEDDAAGPKLRRARLKGGAQQTGSKLSFVFGVHTRACVISSRM